MKNMLIASSFVVLLSSTTALADQVFFENGDKISGQIVSMNHGEPLVFKGSYTNDLHIEWEYVSALFDDMGRPIPVPVNQVEPMAAVQEEMNEVEPAAGDKNNPELYVWSGRANAGGKLEDGNSQKKSVSIDGQIKARNEKNRYIAKVEINWAEDEGEQTKNDRQFDFEYDRFMNEKWFIGSRLNLKADEQAALDLRTKLGAFVGYQFFESDDLNLLTKAGLDYINTEYENDSSENDVAAGWSLDYDQRFYEEAFQLFHNHDLSVPMDETEAFLIETKTGLRVPVGKHLTGTAEVDFDWDNMPAIGIREQDTTYSVKLGYEW